LSSIAFRGLKGPLASLGNWMTIEYKEHRVHGGLSESIESLGKSQTKTLPRVNAAEMRQTSRFPVMTTLTKKHTERNGLFPCFIFCWNRIRGYHKTCGMER
jgi:hypothetical protein